MNISGTRTMQPGIYVVSGGDFKINANANVTGTGVTIYIKAGTNVSINGNATVNLAAPTSGTYSGMLFFGDRTEPERQLEWDGNFQTYRCRLLCQPGYKLPRELLW